MIPICFMLLAHAEALAVSRALLKAGSSMAAKIAIIAITTSSSISVNAVRFLLKIIMHSPFLFYVVMFSRIQPDFFKVKFKVVFPQFCAELFRRQLGGVALPLHCQSRPDPGNLAGHGG